MERKIIEYLVCCGSRVVDMEESVNLKFERGFEPYGPMIITDERTQSESGQWCVDGKMWCQPMVRYAEPDPEQEKADRVKANSAIIMAQICPTASAFNKDLDTVAKLAVCAAIALERQFDAIRQIGIDNKGESKF